jgi:hypothetical protein
MIVYALVSGVVAVIVGNGISLLFNGYASLLAFVASVILSAITAGLLWKVAD